MELLYSNLVTTNKNEFLAKVKSVSADLGIDPNWLMYVMKKESNLNPNAVNPVNGASGLIQFIRSTATGLGFTLEQIRNMTNVEQLDLVKRYYWPYRAKIKSAVDLYFATFYPVAIGKTADYILGSTPSSIMLIAAQNSGIDANKDKKITYQEVQDWFLKGAPQNFLDAVQKKNRPADVAPSNTFYCTTCGRTVVLV